MVGEIGVREYDLIELGPKVSLPIPVLVRVINHTGGINIENSHEEGHGS